MLIFNSSTSCKGMWAGALSESQIAKTERNIKVFTL